jgi:hypothetical protein
MLQSAFSTLILAFKWVVIPTATFPLFVSISEKVCNEMYWLDDKIGSTNKFERMSRSQKHVVICNMSKTLAVLFNCTYPGILVLGDIVAYGAIERDSTRWLIGSLVVVDIVYRIAFSLGTIDDSVEAVYSATTSTSSMLKLLLLVTLQFVSFDFSSPVQFAIVLAFGSPLTCTEHIQRGIGALYKDSAPVYYERYEPTVTTDQFGKQTGGWTQTQRVRVDKWKRYLTTMEDIKTFYFMIRYMEFILQAMILCYWVFTDQFTWLCGMYAIALPSMYSGRALPHSRLFHDFQVFHDESKKDS